MTMEADDSVAKISSSTTDKINEAYTEERSKLAQFRLEQASRCNGLLFVLQNS